jgi:hypothetical protein
MNEIKSFIWAQGHDANVREPIQALQESGWRYGDVPTASNFNWLFKMLTEEIARLKKDLAVQKEELTQALAQQAQRQEERLGSKANELRGQISNSARDLKADITSLSRRQRSDDRQLAICIESTWEILRSFEQVLRHYHPTLPVTPWPSKVWPNNVMAAGAENLD